ncbi:hypothetical protein SLH46_06240 [Draconibacterium sp. IB214405]|uniref:hypothetical protein n=1 Tax=Draconibacterium sp. IB214405 TaxID=3097352 RepID=UPI002A120692|nr:hypothetical protein [Draconibacterium sp. IB214405]MDX8338771.1 hypothetical protein [Draconibacterium sp. IB214405]
MEDSLKTIINAIFFSLVSSFLVGLYFQIVLKDQISKEHLKIIEYRDDFYKAGIIKYYPSFKDCIENLRQDIRKSKNVKIYVTYGSTILNTLSEDISDLLSRKDSKLEVVLMGEKNPFALGYAELWNYSEEQLKNKITESFELLKNKKGELIKQNKLKGKMELFKNNKYPFNSSFYICDNLIYFVPSKHYESKDFVPMTIKAQNTDTEGALYNKVTQDLDFIFKSGKGIEKI